MLVRHSLVGNAGRARPRQSVCLLWIWCEVQVSEECVSRLKHADFDWLRLFHFDDEVAGIEKRIGCWGDPAPDLGVVFIEKPNRGACVGFDHDLMTGVNELSRSARGKPNTGFAVFGFLGCPNTHDKLPDHQIGAFCHRVE